MKRRLINCIDNYESRGDNFSHMEEMKIRFVTYLRNMTYEHFLAQPKQMIETVLIKKLHKNPELLKMFKNMPHPLIRRTYSLLFRDHTTEAPLAINNDRI